MWNFIHNWVARALLALSFDAKWAERFHNWTFLKCSNESISKVSFMDLLIARAQRTPYVHLDGYMHRFWLIPYSNPDLGNGCGTVSPLRRPFSYLLQKLNLAARVHHILRSDSDRHYHDHPFRYLTIILKGGYTEVTPVFDKSGFYIKDNHVWRGPGSVLWRPANSWHRLVVEPSQTAWTLFITGKRTNSWGFLVQPQCKQHYAEYLKESSNE